MKELEIALAIALFIALPFLIFSTFPYVVVEVSSRLHHSRFTDLQTMLTKLFTAEAFALGNFSQTK